jgi:hypothetical protein
MNLLLILLCTSAAAAGGLGFAFYIFTTHVPYINI